MNSFLIPILRSALPGVLNSVLKKLNLYWLSPLIPILIELFGAIKEKRAANLTLIHFNLLQCSKLRFEEKAEKSTSARAKNNALEMIAEIEKIEKKSY